MRKVREILRLHFGAGLSIRQVAQSCNIGRSTVGEYVQRARNAGLGCPLPEGMEAACKRSLAIGSHSYKSVNSILKAGLDQAPLRKQAVKPGPTHENIRGIVNGFPCSPGRTCRNSTGEPIVNRISTATTSITGDSSTNPVTAPIISITRLSTAERT